ncbi:unnamed protein product [Amoebophrya sp. A120]|nr:unnamed protein product [Amoebophrya sp. A120]|eukprot:GSA120T00018428001.1
MGIEIDAHACLLKGLIGGIGAIPGTCGSHPFDVIKIRMQVRAEKLSPAIKTIHAGDFRNFYRGFFPAIEQRLITRGPMFLVSELYTQIVQQNTNLSRTASTYVGSCGSGFTTGFLAGLAEYRKKLLSQNVITKQEARWDNLYRTAKNAGTLPYLLRRLVAAGCCSATYDSFFFGTQTFLAQHQNYGPGLSYGCAAVVAVVAAFAFDTTVARMMVVPPGTPCKSFFATLRDAFQADEHNRSGIARVAKGYRGLSARSVEFFINYSITGMTSVYVIMAFDAVFGTNAT